MKSAKNKQQIKAISRWLDGRTNNARSTYRNRYITRLIEKPRSPAFIFDRYNKMGKTFYSYSLYFMQEKWGSDERDQ